MRHGFSLGLTSQRRRVKVGPELVAEPEDRDFSSDTGFWTKGQGWSITGGSAVAAGASSGLNSNIGTIGKTFDVTYTVLNYTGGAVVGRAGGTNANTTRTGNGTFTDRVVCGAVSRAVGVFGAGFSGSIDGISVREVRVP